MDDVFGRKNFVSNVLWQTRTSPDARIHLGPAHDQILVYAKAIESVTFQRLRLSQEQASQFKNPDNDPRGAWGSTDFTAQGWRPNQMYKITTPGGTTYEPPEGRCWSNIESEFLRLRGEGRMWFGKDDKARPRVKNYLSESEGISSWTWWTNAEVGHNQADCLYRQWFENRPELVAEEEEDSPDPTSTFEEAEETAWAEIRQTLQEMNPYDFQNLVAALLRAMNYYVSWVSPPGRDGGIDILAYTDLLGTKPRRIKVQVKRRADKTNVEGLRSFMALLGDEDVGLFVSTGGFTSDAEAEARTQEKRKITLLGLERLFDLWVEHYQKINEPDKQLLPLKPIYYLAPAE